MQFSLGSYRSETPHTFSLPLLYILEFHLMLTLFFQAVHSSPAWIIFPRRRLGYRHRHSEAKTSDVKWSGYQLTSSLIAIELTVSN